MMGYGPNIEFAVWERSSSALMGVGEILWSLAEHVQGVDVPLAYKMHEFA